MEKRRVNLKKLDWLKSSPCLYETHFSFCTFEKDSAGERKLTQTGDWTMCREILSNRIRSCFTHKHCSVDRNVMRLLILFRNKTKSAEKIAEKNINRSLKIINSFEKELCWNSSRLFKVETPAEYFIYLLRGPRQWMTSPYAVSLYALLARMGKYSDFDTFDTYEQFIKTCNKVVNKTIDSMASDSYRPLNGWLYSWPDGGPHIVAQLYLVIGTIMIFLRNYRSLFRGRTRRDIFMRASSDDGAANLCQNIIRDKKLRKDFINLCICKKADIKYRDDNIYTKTAVIRAKKAEEKGARIIVERLKSIYNNVD